MASRDIARRQVLAPACLSSTELKHAQCSMNVRETPLDKYHMPMSFGTTSKERKESAHLRYGLIATGNNGLDCPGTFSVKCDMNAMSETQTIKEVVFCNHCGAENPPRSAVCCNCGHVHAREIELAHGPEKTVVLERWVVIAVRIICGVALCIARVVPTAGTTVNAALLGRIFGSLAIPVALGAVLGKGNLSRSSRWFLLVALLLPLLRYAGMVLGRIHFR